MYYTCLGFASLLPLLDAAVPGQPAGHVLGLKYLSQITAHYSGYKILGNLEGRKILRGPISSHIILQSNDIYLN